MKHEELTKLRKQFDHLALEEQNKRLRFIAQYYCGSLTRDADFVVDVTKHWPQFEEMRKLDALSALGTVTLGDVLRAA